MNYNPTNNTFTMPSYSIKLLVVFDGTSGSTILTNGDESLVGVDKTSAMEGETITITANSNNSYLLKQVNILKASDDTDITTIVGYNATTKTFTMPDYAVKVVIEYYITHAITVNTNDATMGIILSNKQSALIGDIVTLILTPTTNYKLDTLTILKTSDSSDVTSLVGYNSTTKTFTMPDYEVTVNASYILSIRNPELPNGMTPIKYDGTNWVKADETNTNNDWYNYNTTDKKWANAVMVKESATNGVTNSKSRSQYMSANVNTPIIESDILGYYVWIPRYKYKLFNAGFRAGESAKSIEIELKQHL